MQYLVAIFVRLYTELERFTEAGPIRPSPAATLPEQEKGVGDEGV